MVDDSNCVLLHSGEIQLLLGRCSLTSPTYKKGLDIGLRKQAGWKYVSVTTQPRSSA